MSSVQLWLTRRVLLIAAVFAMVAAGVASRPAMSQQSAANGAPPALPEGTPQSWAQAAAQNELGIIDNDGSVPLRYRTRKIDDKGDTTREVIETRQGSVARLIARNGQVLTAAEDAAERTRLQEELASPSEFIKRHKRASATRQDEVELIQLLPQAMINVYAPGQPQPPGAASRQVVLDFRPNPAFKPPSLVDDVLTGFEGRVWIDPQSHRMTRIEGRVLHPVNFGWGLLGRIYPGGTVEFEQVNAGGSRWVYSHLDAHLTVRVIVKTVPFDDKMTASDFQVLPASVSLEQGIRMLLALPVPFK